MKVSIGSKIVKGPWGGGNLFAINLSNYLIEKGHDVVYDLTDNDIDLILLTDPRSRRESSSTFNHKDVLKYKKYINPNSIVVQRINECDERKNTKNINQFYLDASNVADHVVFVSSWLRDIYLNIGMENKKTSVILAGANKKIFNNNDNVIWDGKERLKLVTHHWSSHFNKGFDIYQLIDQMLNDKNWQKKIDFTYIGNESSEYILTNTNLIKPLSGNDLANEIKNHHIYVTGSINEPSGNHHIEAAQCGLPILYRDSGGIPEYCDGFGVSFNDNFIEKLQEIIDDYSKYKNRIKKYPFSSKKMCDEFFDLFEKLLKSQKKIEINFFQIFISKIYIYKNKVMLFLRKIFSFNIRFKIISMLKKVRNK
tara:strand:- start:217 stop:1317 length:1101 start_codon:yes stop_codon:yes gene_type:complete